jgi:hypothetical protein
VVSAITKTNGYFGSENIARRRGKEREAALINIRDYLHSFHAYIGIVIQGYSKRSIHFQKFILQVLLNTWRRAEGRTNEAMLTPYKHSM